MPAMARLLPAARRMAVADTDGVFACTSQMAGSAVSAAPGGADASATRIRAASEGSSSRSDAASRPGRDTTTKCARVRIAG